MLVSEITCVLYGIMELYVAFLGFDVSIVYRPSAALLSQHLRRPLKNAYRLTTTRHLRRASWETLIEKRHFINQTTNQEKKKKKIDR